MMRKLRLENVVELPRDVYLRIVIFDVTQGDLYVNTNGFRFFASEGIFIYGTVLGDNKVVIRNNGDGAGGSVEIMVTETEINQRFQLQVVQEVEGGYLCKLCRWYVKYHDIGASGSVDKELILKVVVQQQVHQLVQLVQHHQVHKMVFQIHFQTYHHYHLWVVQQVGLEADSSEQHKLQVQWLL